LGQLGYRRHVNRKTKDGSNHPDRDAQFEYITAKAREFQAADQPVISVDTNKKQTPRHRRRGNKIPRFYALQVGQSPVEN
jgi:Rhodopirellula transposase DDE domain